MCCTNKDTTSLNEQRTFVYPHRRVPKYVSSLLCCLGKEDLTFNTSVVQLVLCRAPLIVEPYRQLNVEYLFTVFGLLVRRGLTTSRLGSSLNELLVLTSPRVLVSQQQLLLCCTSLCADTSFNGSRLAFPISS